MDRAVLLCCTVSRQGRPPLKVIRLGRYAWFCRTPGCHICACHRECLKDALGLTMVVDNRASARNSRNVDQLNYVWVEQARGGSLKSDMTTFKEDPGKPF